MACHRHSLLHILYENLPAEARRKILTNKKVVSISTTATGIHVCCSDGSVVEGSIVIGADGVYSTVHQCMMALMPKGITLSRQGKNTEEFYPSTYRVLSGSAPVSDKLRTGNWYEMHGSHGLIQILTGKEKMWFVVYERLQSPTTKRITYSQQDADAFAKRFYDMHASDQLIFEEIYERRLASTLTNTQEGTANSWHFGRIVLVGDAAHKVTPTLGLGFNSGAQDVAVLTNCLRELLYYSKTPDSMSIQKCFAGYQLNRQAITKEMLNLSKLATRMCIWQTRAWRLADYCISPQLNAEYLLCKYKLSPLVRRMPVLSSVKEKHKLRGKLSWKFLPNDNIPTKLH